MIPKFILLLEILAIARADSVVLDDDTLEVGDVDSSLVTGRQGHGTYTTINGQNVMISCTTARNVPGECMPFGECYPIFKLRGDAASERSGDDVDGEAEGYGAKREVENKVGEELKRLYKGVSGPCSDIVLQTISKALGAPVPRESYVCCPMSHYNITARRPSRPPAPTTTPQFQNAQCGNFLHGRNVENETSADGEDEIQGRIVNGRVASRGEFPWAVALLMNGRQFCGGSLIDSQHILTAAHCIYYMNRNDVNRLRVQIGDHNIYSTNDGRNEVRGVTNVYYHRAFSMRTIHDDVSVLRLNSPVQFTRLIQPICLSTNTFASENSYASVAGWGQVSERGYQSSILRTVNVKVWRHQDCVKRYWGKTPGGITRGMVCAGGAGYDSCKGDSGGPLSIKRNSRIEQIGIVSFGIGCGSYPGVYTRTDTYLQWINKNRR